MTLDEAIKHAEEVAEVQEETANMQDMTITQNSKHQLVLLNTGNLQSG